MDEVYYLNRKRRPEASHFGAGRDVVGADILAGCPGNVRTSQRIGGSRPDRRLRGARTLTERRRADARVHIEIAAVAQSPRLTRQEMDLWSEVGDLVWLPVTGGQIAGVTGEHDALVEAIGQQDGERARRLAEQHVLQETARLLDLRLALG